MDGAKECPDAVSDNTSLAENNHNLPPESTLPSAHPNGSSSDDQRDENGGTCVQETENASADEDDSEYFDSDVTVSSDSEDYETDEEEITKEDLKSLRNLKDDLTKLLDDLKASPNSYYCHQAFPDAPNPMVSISDFGPLGLPLSAPEAQRLISSSRQAPFGKGERTVVDKAVRDTWEIDASKIMLENPAWNTWMEKTVVPHVCEILGVSISASAPRAELYKLLLYETGSHFLPHQDTEKMPGMFATIVVTLPSRFSGGQLVLSHAGKNDVIDIAETSFNTTHVMSWYTDIMHSVKPVQSGYRLAFSYNLVHGKNSFKPVVNLPEQKTEKLRTLLKNWSKADRAGHQDIDWKLCFSMDHQYSEMNLRSATLKGDDARLVAIVAPIAAELNFGLYVANVELRKEGAAEEWDGKGRFWKGRTSDTSGFEMTDVYDETLSIECVYDVDGIPMDAGYLSIDDIEMVPGGLGDGDPDEEEYSGYTGNEGGNLEYWYHDSLLIFCPDLDQFRIDQNQICDYAQDVLAKIHVESQAPTKEDIALVNQVLKIMNRGPPISVLEEAMDVLTCAARNWNHLDVWKCAVSSCPPKHLLEAIGNDGFLEALDMFGVLHVENVLLNALHYDLTNSRRLSLIEHLFKNAIERHDPAWVYWFDGLRYSVLCTLKEPEDADVEYLVNAAKCSGTQYFNDVVISQLKSFKPNLNFWLSLLSGLSQARSLIPPEPQAVGAIVSNVLDDILSNVAAFPVLAKTSSSYSYSLDPPAKKKPDIDSWSKAMELCLLLPSSGNCRTFVEKMRNTYANEKDDEKIWILDTFVGPAVRRLDTILNSKEVLKSGDMALIEFFDFATELFVENRLSKPDCKEAEIEDFISAASRSHVSLLNDKLSTGVIESLVKKYPKLAPKLLQGVFEMKKAREMANSDTESCERIVFDIVKAIILETSLSSNPEDIKHWQLPLRDVVSPAVKTTMDLLALCFDFEVQSLASDLLDKLLLHVASFSDETHITCIERVLVPIIPRIKEFLSQRGQSLSAEPFRQFTAQVLNDYVKIVLGTRPAESVPLADIKAVGCGCADCERLVSFFIGTESVLLIQEKVNVRKHLLQQLEATRRWGVKWKIIVRTSPETVQVIKPSSLAAATHWIERKERGLKFLQSVGTTEELSNILGSDYTLVADALGFRSPLAVLKASGWSHGSANSEGSNGKNRGSKRLSMESNNSQKRIRMDGNAGGTTV
ncbi:hypothetical protein SCHPADRAFT_999401 [Schizopora paradoxa]|uniref:Prolyl 4-hydroxylase alpha subunit Fe(2+) 2OG dioxygenase domain-containing protein n=1 Tax=Schizopora paradoxa TaxID=27342 RepID=A0A0H2RFV5_9AGAM|nr:hypothetical protein SCHPADRAFT_999401 [Schizopora paradoxa]